MCGVLNGSYECYQEYTIEESLFYYILLVLLQCACVQQAYSSYFVCLSVCLSVSAISVSLVEIKCE